jgi:hypothetical protein
MKKALLIITTLTMLLTTTTVASGSQVDGSNQSGAFITEDGILVRGDTRIDCGSFARLVEQYEETQTTDPYAQSELQQAKGALQECEAYGFSASDGGVSDEEGATTPKHSTPDSQEFFDDEVVPNIDSQKALPDTGGPVRHLLLLVSVLFLGSVASLGLLYRR